MTKEEFIKKAIMEKGYNIKSFSRLIELPYTTLVGILNRGIDGASTQNVMQICKGLEITIEELLQLEVLTESITPFRLTEKEKVLVQRYRNCPSMHFTIAALLKL